MNNKIALSVSQMQYLQDLGLDTSDASMCWGKWKEAEEFHLFAETYDSREAFIEEWVDEEDAEGHETYPAYTLQDLLEKLPEMLPDPNPESEWTYELLVGHCVLSYHDCLCDESYHYEEGETVLEAAYKMLVWCIENKYV